MFKITAIVSLMFIGSTLWAADLSCDSCGNECVSACGTRHFRSCCFNYLKKRTPGAAEESPRGGKFWRAMLHELKMENSQHKAKVASGDNVPEPFAGFEASDLKPYYFEETPEFRLQAIYDV